MKNKIGIIISREYSQRVAKKSFIITTLLLPLLMVALSAAPALIMMFGGTSESTVLVIDNSGVIGSKLADRDETKFVRADITLDSALRRDDISAVLVIPNGIERKEVQTPMKYYSNGPSSMITETQIKNQVNDIIEEQRAQSYEIANIRQILDDLRSDVSMQTVRNDKDAQEAAPAELSSGLGIALTFVMYMFMLLYGQMVMTSIVEEKNNRVLEIVVSSVSPTQMMMGKIIGVGLVAVTQVLIWGVLMMLMSAFLLPAILPASAVADIAAVNAGNMSAVSDTSDLALITAVATLTNVGFIFKLLVAMLVFLIGGFLFYSAIYAAIGSAVDNIQDAGQLQIFTVVPILIGMIFSMSAATDPNSTIAFWLSIIPFTSPMVMMARIPFDIPGWEVILSAVILYLSFLGMVWVAAKIYRVGIFMYGKKPNVKELIRWVKYK